MLVDRGDMTSYKWILLTMAAVHNLQDLAIWTWLSSSTHFKVNHLFSNKQFGFIKGRSTSLQLLKILDKWTELLDWTT